MPIIQRQIHWFWILVWVLAYAQVGGAAPEARSSKSVQSMDIQRLNTVEQVEASFAKLKGLLDQENSSSFESRKAALLKIGECIGKLAALTSSNQRNPKTFKAYSDIRNTLKNVIHQNEQQIQYFQDHKLDQMANPAEFFKSAEWQNPQDLISLASYWLGWNGYYGGLQAPENSAVQTEWLQEAVKGFSRSFIDFEEEDVVLRSLLGRALCQSKLKAYDHAKKDLSAVKKRLNKQDPLYLRCLYEECRILYATGNLDLARRALEEIQEDYSKKDMPPEIAKGFDQLKGKIFMGFLEKETKEDQKPAGKIDPTRDKIFSGLKQLAAQPAGVHDFYRYTRENADRMKHLTYSDLGPVGAWAMGDAFFENKEYDKALNHYLPLYAESPKHLKGKMDMVRFRMATIHALKKNWRECLPVLKDFHQQHPDSYLLEQAIPLYYLAAANHYRQTKDSNAYRQFVDAAKVYATRCRGKCPDLSEAHFQLGQYYQKTGDTEKAVKEFLRVNQDSPNFLAAHYQLLQHFVKQLEEAERAGRSSSKESQRIFRESSDVVKRIQDHSLNKRQAGALKRLAPYLAVLEAKRVTFDEPPRDAEILARVQKFETLYPKEEALFPEVFQLRAHGYFNLGQTESLQTEIADFASSTPVNKARYDALKNLARDFYMQTKSGGKAEPSEGAEKAGQAALMVYQQLYSISLSHPEFGKDGDAIQLRMAQIHIDKNQLDPAEALYREILKRNSLSADAFYGLGLLYEKKEQWADALETWRRFSDGVKDGTYHWYESRYRTARAHENLGNTKKACEILTITMVLHPELGNEALAEKYRALKNTVCKEGP
jgi:tetratricopeptide (TPR) repeat protein